MKCLYLNLPKITESLISPLKKILFSKNEEHFYKLLESVIIDYNCSKFDILLTTTNFLGIEHSSGIFSKIKFNLVFFDLIDPNSVMTVKSSIKTYTEESRVIILKSLNFPEKDDFSINFSNFLYTFYDSQDYLIEPSRLILNPLISVNLIPPNLKLLSKGKKIFPTQLDDMLSHLKLEYKWSVFNFTSNSNSLGKENYFFTIRNKNLLEYDVNARINTGINYTVKSYGIILFFVPVQMSKNDFVRYMSILQERKQLVLMKKGENKSD